MPDATRVQQDEEDGAFRSAGELRKEHTSLIEALNRHLVKDASAENEAAALKQLEPQIRRFLERGAATGVYVEEIEERTACQVLLDYWVSSLSRAGIRVSGTPLAQFDIEKLPILNDEDCPYVGLEAFTFKDRRNFYGREHDTRELLELVLSTPLVIVLGASGSGKSSLVMGGVLPALKEKGWTPELSIISPFVPGNAVLDKLVNAVLQVRPDPCGVAADEVAFLRQDPKHLYTMLGSANAQPTLITIDQFEEVFTLSDDADREALVANLAQFLEADQRHRVILTVREEFRNRIAELRALSPHLVEKAWYSMRPMSYEELKAAVEKPAEKVNLQFQPKEIVDDLVQKVLGQDAALPLLQFTLRSLWKIRDRNRITRDVYEVVGSPLEAIKNSADKFYNDLLPEDKDEFERILLELVRVDERLEAYRQPVLKSRLLQAGKANTEHVLKLLEINDYVRIITPVGNDADALVEVKHESLVRNWPQYVMWINEKRDKRGRRLALTQAAKRWEESGRPEDGLLTGWQVEEAKGQLDLSELEKEFVQASTEAVDRMQREKEAALRREAEQAKALAEAERKRADEQKGRAQEQAEDARRFRRLTMWLLFVSIVTVAACVFAIFQYQKANDSRGVAVEAQKKAEGEAKRADAQANIANEEQKKAEQEKDRAVAAENLVRQQAKLTFSRELAASAINNLNIDPERSVLLSLEAGLISGSVNKTSLPEVENALHQSLQAMRLKFTISGHTNLIWDLAFSQNGVLLAAASDDKTKIWDIQTKKTLLTLSGHMLEVYGVAFSPDGKRIATASRDKTVKVWDVAKGNELLTLVGHKNTVSGVAFSSNGKRIATASADRMAKVWDANTGEKLLDLIGHKDWVFGVAFSPDGKRIATASYDQTVKVWDANSGEELLTLVGHTGEVLRVKFDSAGRRLVTSSWDGTAGIWDAENGKELVTLYGHKSGINDVAFSPDGKRIATAGSDGTTKVWDVLSGQEQFTLSGHNSNVRCVTFTPDGKRLATGGWDGTTKIWDSRLGTLLFTLPGDPTKIYAVAIDPNGGRFVTAGRDRTAKMWDIYTGEKLKTFIEPKGGVSNVIFSDDGKKIATANYDMKARIWDAGSGVLLHTLSGHTDAINGVAFSPDGKRLATASWDHTARVWDAASGVLLRTLSRHTDAINGVAFSPDGKRLATASWDHTARVWNAASGVLLRTLYGHTGYVHSVAFSPDGKFLATASEDRTAKIWDAETGKQEFTLSAHDGPVFKVTFSPSGKYIATAGYDGKAIVWDFKSRREAFSLSNHKKAVSDVAFSPDETDLVTVSWDGITRVWDISFLEELPTLIGHSGQVYKVVFSPDGKLIATASGDATASVWDAETGKELLALKGHDGSVTCVAFDMKGTRIATGGMDKTAKVWDAKTGKELLPLKGHDGGVTCVAFDMKGTRIATGSTDGTTKVWDAQSGTVERTFSGHVDSVSGVAFSPDGKYLATASWDRMVKVWEVETGKQRLTLSGHTDIVRDVAFSQDGTRLGTCSNDGTAKIWDAISGKELLTLLGHSYIVSGIAFSPDGKHIATSSWDKTTKVWDGISGQELVTLTGHTGVIYDVAFNPDGSRLATASADSTVRQYVLNINIDELIRMGAMRVTRSLTVEECQKYLRGERCSSEAINLIVEGKNRVRNGDVNGAILSFRKAMKLKPVLISNPEKEATRLKNQAIDEKKRDLEKQCKIYSDLAGELRIAKNFDQAISFANKAIKANPDYGYAYIVLGRTMSDMGKYEDAVTAFSKVKKNDPEYESAINSLGATYFDKLYKYGEAYQTFKQARELYPDNKTYTMNFAEANLATERFEEARKLAQKVLAESEALRLDVNEQLFMRFIVISSHILQGNTAEAVDGLGKFIDYYRSVADKYKPMWTYDGTKHFIKTRSMNENQRNLLLKLIHILEVPTRDIAMEDFQEFLK